MGVRLGDVLAYVTDTAADPATVDFVRGVEWLLHEVWASDSEAQKVDPSGHGHAAAGKVLEIALAAGARHLVPIHHHPKRDAGEVRALASAMGGEALGRRLDVVVAEEGRPIPLVRSRS